MNAGSFKFRMSFERTPQNTGLNEIVVTSKGQKIKYYLEYATKEMMKFFISSPHTWWKRNLVCKMINQPREQDLCHNGTKGN